MGRAPRVLAIAAVAVAAALPASAVPADAAEGCSTAWGSQAERVPAQGWSVLTNVRAGRHACFDRLVFDGASMAWVAYVDQVRSDGSGHVVPTRGGARLQITTNGSIQPEDEPWEVGYEPADRDELVAVGGWQTFRQVTHAGEFEGQLTVGLGVRARLPFRVLLLTANGAPPRIVVDVAHRW